MGFLSLSLSLFLSLSLSFSLFLSLSLSLSLSVSFPAAHFNLAFFGREIKQGHFKVISKNVCLRLEFYHFKNGGLFSNIIFQILTVSLFLLLIFAFLVYLVCLVCLFCLSVSLSL